MNNYYYCFIAEAEIISLDAFVINPNGVVVGVTLIKVTLIVTLNGSHSLYFKCISHYNYYCGYSVYYYVAFRT